MLALDCCGTTCADVGNGGESDALEDALDCNGATGAEGPEGTSEAGDATGGDVDAPGAAGMDGAGADDAIDADIDGMGGSRLASVVGADAGGAETPGGGAATASGSSISSSGRSGRSSSNGEADTPAATPVNEMEFSVGGEAGGLAGSGVVGGAGGACSALIVPLSELLAAGVGTAGAFDGVGEAAWGAPTWDDVPTAGATGVGASRDVAVTGVIAGGLGDLFAGVAWVVGAARNGLVAEDALTGGLGGADVPADAAAREGRIAVDAPNDALGALDVPKDGPAAAGAAASDGPPVRTAVAGPAVAGFPAGAAPLGATPTGLDIFLPAGADGSEIGVVRGAALAAPGIREELVPMETPTGRETPACVVPDGEDGTSCL
ncbi:MAG: hypothetical protein ACJ8R9_24670 [Steroidobacteraceae bacterium]